jgi:hypothetical protein
VCDNGACRTCGGPGEPCCPGDTCDSGCCDQGADVCIVDGTACRSGGTCGGGVCVCDANTLNCGNGCRDITANVDQCGACGTTCRADEFCVNSACECRPGLVRSGADCVNPDSNPAACGPAATACGGATPRCENGACVAQCSGNLDTCGNACVNPETDPEHCGGCNNPCNRDEVCVQGNCEQFDAAVGCNACPCAACGGGDSCCEYPGTTLERICVNSGGCPLPL